MASNVLITISKDEIEEARRISEEKYELDTRSRLYAAEQKGEQKIIDMLKSGKSPEEIINEYSSKAAQE